MAIPSIYPGLNEDIELITSRDLVCAANEVMGNIDLDVASSDIANKYVGADAYFTPKDDGLNEKTWYGKVYLFSPPGAYFWDEKNFKWKRTRSTAKSLRSSHAVWFSKLYKSWLKDEIEQGIFFCNCPDMLRYDQKIFDFPICIPRTSPNLLRVSNGEVKPHKTCTSLIVYLQPKDDPGEATQRFIDVYSAKGRVIY